MKFIPLNLYFFPSKDKNDSDNSDLLDHIFNNTLDLFLHASPAINKYLADKNPQNNIHLICKKNTDVFITQHTSLSLLYNYSKEDISLVIREIQKFPRNIESEVRIYNFPVNAGIPVDYFSLLLSYVKHVVITNIHAGKPLSSVFNRRRPCKYAFDNIYVDSAGNVYPCPYCKSKPVTKFYGVEKLCNDTLYLTFLASQLLLSFDDYPECASCYHWCDCWLANESEEIKSISGKSFSLDYNGNDCIISYGGKE